MIPLPQPSEEHISLKSLACPLKAACYSTERCRAFRLLCCGRGKGSLHLLPWRVSGGSVNSAHSKHLCH